MHPHGPGILHPASGPRYCPQLPASPRLCTGCHSFCLVPVISLSTNLAGAGVLWVSGRPETGLRHSHWFFAAALLNMRRSSHRCSDAVQQVAGCWIKAQSLLFRKRSFPTGLLFNCYKSKLSGPSNGKFLKKKKKKPFPMYFYWQKPEASFICFIFFLLWNVH